MDMIDCGCYTQSCHKGDFHLDECCYEQTTVVKSKYLIWTQANCCNEKVVVTNALL